MGPESQKKVCVIDGQGGGIGATIIKKLKERFGERIEVFALGTNAIATAQMLKAKANKGASGSNAIVQTVKKADVIIGPVGIIMDRQKAIKAFFNVLTKGGRLAVLELTTPEKGIFRSLYLLYFQKILPILGSFFSKDNNAYSYLPDSVLKFPSPVEFSRLMKGAGFENIKFKQMTFGIVTLFVGSKP